MRKNNFFIIIELFLISFYFLVFLLSIKIIIIKLVLGIICVLFLPGYNLLNIIKPDLKHYHKLGYMTIVSLAISNSLMFFSYIFLFDLIRTQSSPQFYFNEIFLISTIECLNIAFIIIIKFREFRYSILENKNTPEFKLNCNLIKKFFKNLNLDLKKIIIYLIFITSLILLSISAFQSDVPNREFHVVHADYRLNFTFFRRIPILFYFFLSLSIISLIYIIFYTENTYLILISISIFFYTLWILPYLQIWNYFGEDSYNLFKMYKDYEKGGIRANSNRSIMLKGGSFRYSTSLFTAILLVMVTGENINFVLWYIYPLILVFSPFFFYSIFEQFNIEIDGKKEKLKLKLLTVFALLTNQFLKCAHSATTMVLGIYIFFILVIEIYYLSNSSINKFNLKNFFFIFFLFFFLCITHFEEVVYFLIIIFFYSLYYLYTNAYKLRLDNINSNKINMNKFEYQAIYKNRDHINSEVINHEREIYDYNILKRTIFIFGMVLLILLIIFYLTQEFFRTFSYYFFNIVGINTYSRIIFAYYEDTKFLVFPILRGSYSLSIFAILLIFLSLISYFLICYLLFIRFYNNIFDYWNLLIICLSKVFNKIRKIISYKLFQILILFSLYFFIFLINLLYYEFLQETGTLMIIELFLNYTVIIFHVFLLIMGMRYYKIKNTKQNYFLLSIIASFIVMFFLFLAGNVLLTFHLLNSRVPPIIFFFNLIIIQDTYFEKMMKLKKKYLVLLVISLLFLGTFYSLNKIGWE